MNIIPTEIADLFVIDCPKHQDDRGMFARLFCQRELAEAFSGKQIVQVNLSHTVKEGAIRGLHFQLPPKMETKLVRCIDGEVFDVAVDLRANSKTFMHWYGERLSATNNKMVIIPEGFAHGFQALSKDAKMLYLHTEYYAPDHEKGLRFDDPQIAIDWPLTCSEISSRDKAHPLLDNSYKGIII